MNKATVVDRFATPQFVIAYTLIALFAVAYALHPNDGTLNGAIIAAFSAAWGFFIGSALKGMSQPIPDKTAEVKVVNTKDDPIPVE